MPGQQRHASRDARSPARPRASSPRSALTTPAPGRARALALALGRGETNRPTAAMARPCPAARCHALLRGTGHIENWRACIPRRRGPEHCLQSRIVSQIFNRRPSATGGRAGRSGPGRTGPRRAPGQRPDSAGCRAAARRVRTMVVSNRAPPPAEAGTCAGRDCIGRGRDRGLWTGACARAGGAPCITVIMD